MPESGPEPLPVVSFDTFQKLDIRCGMVIAAEPFPEARKPSLKLNVDFGPPLGVRQSSAQLTLHYTPKRLVGQEVLAVVNFPPRRIAGYSSEVLVLGLVRADDPADVVLVHSDQPGTRGRRLA
ncbi:MAG: tRNA-binding protein [Candidatus Dormibacteria bacterium]